MLPESRQARSRLALSAQKLRRNPSPTNVAAARAARRDYAAVALAEHIRRVVDNAPPLTVEQCDTLVAILRGSA